MKRVLVKSVFDAFEYALKHYYPAGLEDMVEMSDTYAVISIQDSHTNGFGVTFTENQFCKGVLTLYFDDIVREVKDAVLFSEKMAFQIIYFILKHKEVDTLLIHCYAGQSRSRAVGAFAVKMLGGDNSIYFKKYNPNLHVYDTLEEAWNVHNIPEEAWERTNNILQKLFNDNTGIPMEISYTGNEFADVDRCLEEFCRRSPAAGMHMDYLDTARELADLYGEMLCIDENEKTLEGETRTAELAAEIVWNCKLWK